MPFEHHRSTARTLLASIIQNTDRVNQLLNNASNIRWDGPSTPQWLIYLRDSQESLSKAIAYAMRDAERPNTKEPQ